eukprot:362665-Chlamydomonas_euryale.AAC.4
MQEWRSLRVGPWLAQGRCGPGHGVALVRSPKDEPSWQHRRRPSGTTSCACVCADVTCCRPWGQEGRGREGRRGEPQFAHGSLCFEPSRARWERALGCTEGGAPRVARRRR